MAQEMMKKMYWLFWGMLLLSALLLNSCARDGAGQAAGSSSGSGAGSGLSSASSAKSVTFEGTDLEGNAVSSDILSHSKLTMVNVWATYCGPCLREMPALGELAAEYDAEDFQLIGIVSDVMEGADQSTAESLVRETGASYPHLLLNESIYLGLLSDVTAVPTTFFLNQKGAVLDTVVGAMEKDAWEEKINELLEGL